MFDHRHPVLFVIFGVSGDLSKRKLLPALYRLAKQGGIPPSYKILGISRQDDYTLEHLFASLQDYLPEADQAVLTSLKHNMEIIHNGLDTTKDLESLKHTFQEQSVGLGMDAIRIYYLSIPPNAFGPLVGLMGQTGHDNPFPNEAERPRLLVEKPFGYDSASAKQLIDAADAAFGENQIYRIDHYLARETAQNILVFRFQNALFESVWNSQHICNIKIAAHETIDIEGRANFYEQTGALRDIIQSHLLQLLALMMMRRPSSLDSESIHAAKLQLLQSITPITGENVREHAVRAQYDGYKETVNNPESNVETFARLHLKVNDDQWQGTHITLETGKGLNERASFVEVTFRPYDDGADPNVLVFRLQPLEGISLHLLAKRPGLTNETQAVDMEFDYAKSFDSERAEPYERVIRDAIRGDQTLFASGQEVLASWNIVDAVLDKWAESGDGLLSYELGDDPAGIM